MPCQAVPGIEKGLGAQEELWMVSLNAIGFPSVSRIVHLLNNVKVIDKEFYP